MKLCVLNFSGNVGKTTVADHLLHPRMHAAVLRVDHQPMDGPLERSALDTEQWPAFEFGAMQQRLATLPRAIVDVASSDTDAFLTRMQQYAGSHEDFDGFVVPVVNEAKQQADTVRTVRTLRAIGVPAKKLRVLFNKVEPENDLRADFATVYALVDTGEAVLSRGAVMHFNEVYDGMKLLRKSVAQLCSDPTDYRQKLREATNETEQDSAIQMFALKQLAKTCNKNLDTAYEALFSA